MLASELRLLLFFFYLFYYLLFLLYYPMFHNYSLSASVRGSTEASQNEKVRYYPG